MIIPHEMTVLADRIQHVKSGRRYNFKYRDGKVEVVFSAQVRDLKCYAEGYRRLRLRGARVAA